MAPSYTGAGGISTDPQAEHGFGFSLAIDGDLAVAGAQGDDDRGDWAGAASSSNASPGCGPRPRTSPAARRSTRNTARASSSTVAHPFTRGPDGWSEVGRRFGAVGGGIAYGLALDGDQLLVRDNLGSDAFGSSVHTFTFAPHLVTPFCFCNEAGCHNEDPLAGCRNATGVGARLVPCGSTSVSTDDLALVATDVVPKQFAILIMGRDEIPPAFLGNGRLCIADPNALRPDHVEKATSAGRVEEDLGAGDVARVLAALRELSAHPPARERLGPLVEDAAFHADERVAVAACRALERMGRPASLTALVSALEDRRPAVHGAARRALESLAGPQVFSVLGPRAR